LLSINYMFPADLRDRKPFKFAASKRDKQS